MNQDALWGALSATAHSYLLLVLILFASIELGLSASLNMLYGADPDRLPSEGTLDVVRLVLTTSLYSLVSTAIYLLGSRKMVPRPTKRTVLGANAACILFPFLLWIWSLMSLTAEPRECWGEWRYCRYLRALRLFAWAEWISLVLAHVYLVVAAQRSHWKEGYEVVLQEEGLPGPGARPTLS